MKKPKNNDEMPADKVELMFDGENVNLRDIVLNYAYRGIPPDEFTEKVPEDRYLPQRQKLERALTETKDWNDAESEKAAKADFRKELKRAQSDLNKQNKATASLVGMIRKLNEWRTPSEELEDLKRGIIDSITLRFNNNHFRFDKIPVLLNGKTYKRERIKELKKDIAMYKRIQSDDVEVTTRNNEYLRLLLDSLK